MTITVITLIALIVAAVVGWLLVAGRAAGNVTADTGASSSDGSHEESLAYIVPEGHDPAIIMMALIENGLRPTSEMRGGSPVVLVPEEQSTEVGRDRVREIIASADSTSPTDPAHLRSPVTFEDER